MRHGPTHEGGAAGQPAWRGDDPRPLDPHVLKGMAKNALVRRARILVGRHNEIEAELIACLGEIERRKAYIGKACNSLFSFCVRVLNVSEDVAFNRIKVARAARRFPEVLVALREGRVHLTGLRLLAPYLTVNNCSDLLAEASGKTRRQIEEIVARLNPTGKKRNSIRRERRGRPGNGPGTAGRETRERGPGSGARTGQAPRPVPAPSPPAWDDRRPDASEVERPRPTPYGAGAHPPPHEGPHGSDRPSEGGEGEGRGSEGPALGVPAPDEQDRPSEEQRPQLYDDAEAGADEGDAGPRRPEVKPLSEDYFRLHLTVSRTQRDRLFQARDLLSHSIPDGDLAEVIDRGITLLVERTLKERFGVGRKPRAKAAPKPLGPAGRDIPAEVMRKVYERDGGRCAYVDDEGRRCNATAFLQLHHLDGFTYVREHDPGRIELRCRAHNQGEADEMFGREFMDRFRRSGRPREE